MRVELDLPDWCDERHIRVFAGIEEVARKVHRKRWEIKTARCNKCGICCMNVKDNWRFGIDSKTGWCKNLSYDGHDIYLCGIDRPFTCCAGDMAGEDFCSVTWQKVE